MSVYVDQLRRVDHSRLGRFSCHLLADTHDELEAMARRLCLDPTWIQSPASWREHYDLSTAKRISAIGLGAVELTHAEVGLLLYEKDRAGAGSPL